MEFITPVNIVISSIGVVLNLANMIVFLLQDWRTNNVTLTLLSLSVTDLLVLVTSLIFDLFSIMQALLPASTFDYVTVQYYIIAWTLAMFSDLSSLTTVLVSLERCLCIIIPLHVQSLFSVKRTASALASVWILVGLSYAVLFSTSTLHWTSDVRLNTSRLTVSLSKDRQTIEMAHNISNTIILPSFCELAVVINTVVMVIGLKRSSNFQKKSTNLSTQVKYKRASSDHGRNLTSRYKRASSDHERNLTSRYKRASSAHERNLTSRYKRLGVVVCCISGIFMACNTPTVLIVYCKHFVTGFSYSGVHSMSYVASMYVIFLLYAVNASVNFFVYFSLNRRFRVKLKEILRCANSSETN